MYRNSLRLFFSIAALCIITQVAVAGRFDPLFKIVRYKGKCSIKAPGASKFISATQGKTYPYGTTIKTGRKSSTLIHFSQGNECRILANALLTIAEDTKDSKLKTINLDQGEIRVTLEETFHEHNALNVETATAICGAIGCDFSVDSKSEHELTVSTIKCHQGKIKVFGDQFEIPIMETDDLLSVAGSRDMSFTRLKNVTGDFVLMLRDAAGAPKEMKTKSGSVCKIWRKDDETGNTRAITILITSPNGTILETISYKVEIERPLDEDKGKDTDAQKDSKKTKKPKPDAPDPVATTTTTTTIPSVTPVGQF